MNRQDGCSLFCAEDGMSSHQKRGNGHDSKAKSASENNAVPKAIPYVEDLVNSLTCASRLKTKMNPSTITETTNTRQGIMPFYPIAIADLHIIPP